MSYAQVNGLNMYYEIHGSGWPLVMLHGGISNIETDFGLVLPGLAKDRQVIAIEQQAHGRTADIDRSLSVEQMAEDTAALLHQIGVDKADFFGYSMGAAIALQIAIKKPDLVGKLVLAAISYRKDGVHSGTSDSVGEVDPEMMAATQFGQAYTRLAPNPGGWPNLLKKVGEWGKNIEDWRPEDVRSVKAPVLLLFGDSDIVKPEHAVEMFRLLGGGVPGDIVGLPRSRLAILPGTTHITLVHRADWLVSMISDFLEAPVPDTAARA